MSVQPGKALVEMSDEELRSLLQQVSKAHVAFGYNDILGELERRRMEREAVWTFRLSLIALVIAALSLFASVLLALFGH